MALADPHSETTQSANTTSVTTGRVRPWWLRLLRSLVLIVFGAGLLGLLMVFIASFFAQQYFYAELLSHFRAQYLAVGLVMLLMSRWVANRAFTWLTVLLLLPHLVQVAPFYYPLDWTRQTRTPPAQAALDTDHAPATQTTTDTNQPLKILSFNVYAKNTDYQTTIDYLRQCDADVIGLVECSPEWERHVRQGIQDLYPYDGRQVLPGWSGDQIFSRIPLQSSKQDPQYSQVPRSNQMMVVQANFQGRPFLFGVVHPSSPDSEKALKRRNREFEKIGAITSQVTSPLILVGDYNCSSGSPYFRQLLNVSGLHDSRKGFGWQGSWPSFAPFAMIPIDHVLTSAHWKTRYREIGPNLGSDHLPVYAELEWQDDSLPESYR